MQALLGRAVRPGRGLLPPAHLPGPGPGGQAPGAGRGTSSCPSRPPPKVRPEAGARPVIQRPGQQSQVQRSGQPQPEKTLLPMAANTGKGAVKHEPGPGPAHPAPLHPPLHHRAALGLRVHPHQDVGHPGPGPPARRTGPLHPAAPGPSPGLPAQRPGGRPGGPGSGPAVPAAPAVPAGPAAVPAVPAAPAAAPAVPADPARVPQAAPA